MLLPWSLWVKNPWEPTLVINNYKKVIVTIIETEDTVPQILRRIRSKQYFDTKMLIRIGNHFCFAYWHISQINEEEEVIEISFCWSNNYLQKERSFKRKCHEDCLLMFLQEIEDFEKSSFTTELTMYWVLSSSFMMIQSMMLPSWTIHPPILNIMDKTIFNIENYAIGWMF